MAEQPMTGMAAPEEPMAPEAEPMTEETPMEEPVGQKYDMETMMGNFMDMDQDRRQLATRLLASPAVELFDEIIGEPAMAALREQLGNDIQLGGEEEAPADTGMMAPTEEPMAEAPEEPMPEEEEEATPPV